MTNIEDVEKQFDDLLPWEKREFISRHLGLVTNTMSDTEIYKTFGVDRDSDINDASDAVDTFGAYDLLDEIAVYEMADYFDIKDSRWKELKEAMEEGE